MYIFFTGIQKLILAGRISEGIEATQSLYPGLLDRNLGLMFKLKCRQFVEMVSGCDSEVKPSAHSPTRSGKSSPSASPSRVLGHSSLASSSTSNGFDESELGVSRGIDALQTATGNGVTVEEDMEVEDETAVNPPVVISGSSASGLSSSSSQNSHNQTRG